jgi:succinate dehydrogenase/fumarate reductase flavoprotein subunit
MAQPLDRERGVSPISLRKKIQTSMYQNVGIIRNEKGLKGLIQVLDRIRVEELPNMKVSPNRICNYEWVESVKVRNMVLAASVIAKSALYREESRGVHYREDFLESKPDWLVNINARLDNGEIETLKTPVVINKNHPMESQVAG